MKKLFLLIGFVFSISTFAQNDCEYSTNVTDSLGTYKSTKDYLVQEKIFGGNQNSIYFSLINSDGMPSLQIQILQRSSDFVKANCFDKNSKVYFQLNNGKIITLLYIDEDNNCGSSVRNENINNRILTGHFVFMADTFEDLKLASISLMRIKFTSETVDYIMRSELISEIDGVKYEPENYFLKYLKCVEN